MPNAATEIADLTKHLLPACELVMGAGKKQLMVLTGPCAPEQTFVTTQSVTTQSVLTMHVHVSPFRKTTMDKKDKELKNMTVVLRRAFAGELPSSISLKYTVDS